jgi:hypothetical protein
MVRGHFATSLYASLSRSQIDFGGPSTFGLEVTRFPYAYDAAGEKRSQNQLLAQTESTIKDTSGVSNGSSFALGRMIDRGCFNYRWPVTEYYLELHPYQKAIENAKRKERESKQSSTPMDTIPEAPDSDDEETTAGGNEGSGTQQQAQSAPSGETGTGGNDETGATQHSQNIFPGQTGTGVNEGSGTRQHAPKIPSGRNSTEQEVAEMDTPEQEAAPKAKPVGTCQMFSCALGDMFYQILRIEELRPSENNNFELSLPADSQIVLTMGGPVCK